MVFCSWGLLKGRFGVSMYFAAVNMVSAVVVLPYGFVVCASATSAGCTVAELA